MKVLKFEADWCGPCKRLGEWLNTVTLQHEVEVVDIDAQPDLVEQYGIRGIPTVILVDDEGNQEKFATGLEPAKHLLKGMVVTS